MGFATIYVLCCNATLGFSRTSGATVLLPDGAHVTTSASSLVTTSNELVIDKWSTSTCYRKTNFVGSACIK